ncbi:peptidylprolyl isomerase [Aquifex sp.]
MFGFIQKHKKLGIALVAVASASFLFWMFSVSDIKQMFGGSACVAEVGGNCITLREYRFELLKYARFLENPSFAPVVKQLVLNSLITREALSKKAEELGLLVSDQELLEVIKSDPNFQENGKFSLKLYKEVLQRINLTPEEYEDILRKSLMAQKVLKLVEKGVYVLPEEVEIQKKYAAMLFSGKLYIVKPKDVKLDYEPKEEELRKFYAENKEKYKEPEKKVFYLWKTESKEEAQEIYKALKEGKTKEGFTEFRVPDKELPEEVKDVAESLKPQEFKLLKKKDTYYIVFLKEVIPARVRPYEEVKEEVKKAYLEKLRSEKLKEYAERIKEKILKGEKVEIKPVKFEEHDLERLSRVVLIPAEDRDELIFGKKKVFGPYRVLNGEGVLVIEERREKELTDEELEKVRKDVKTTKLRDLEGMYVEKLINTYGVKVNKELIR